MSRQGLVPTPTVDKNGKSTTVYRRTGSSTSKVTLPAPKLTAGKRAAKKTSTPIDKPRQLTEDEFKKFLKSSHNVISDRFIKTINEEASLLVDIRRNGHVSDETLRMISRHMGVQSISERVRHFDYNAFMILERICRDEGESFIDGWSSVFMDALEGLGRRRIESSSVTIPPIETEEELDGYAAVAKMMVFAAKTEPMDYSYDYGTTSFTKGEFHTNTGTRHNGSWFKCFAFSTLLRERPEDYLRIERWVQDRGVPRKNSDVELLREYLDSDNAVEALSDGWL